MEFESGPAPGPAKPVPVIAHAGEYVITPAQLAALWECEQPSDDEVSE